MHAIESYRAGALERVMPAFTRIAEEADAAAAAEFERLGAMPADLDGWTDMADLAESATEHGVAFYETLRGLRQGVLNLLAVGLHHLFEQQQLFFFQRALTTKEEKISTLEAGLADACGIDIKTFSCAATVHELRITANAIKHGKGSSADKLARLRPDLFENPILAQHLASLGLATMDADAASQWAGALVAPLAGHGLYVTEKDVTQWCDAAMAYWLELAAILEAVGLRDA